MKKILCVDDDKEILDSLKEILEIHGYEVIACDDGAEALSKIEDIMPDLVISDIIMPGVDGASIKVEVRMNRELRNIPVIFVSGMVNTETGSTPGERENIMYLSKPVVINELLALVKKALKED